MSQTPSTVLPAPTSTRLPPWRGFNLLELYIDHASAGRDPRQPYAPFQEWDFAFMARWGFNFARLPMSYWCWAERGAWLALREEVVGEIDRAIELGRQYGVHVNLNLHRAPGYCINPPAEPRSLWTDSDALDACAYHWAAFARRYRGIPNQRLSFDLVNEPTGVDEAGYTRVVRHLVQAIRSEDPDRLIIADGLNAGSTPVPSLAGLGIAQSTRGYAPGLVSHYRAPWVRGAEAWPEPTWPLRAAGARRGAPEDWDRQRLRRAFIVPWRALEASGVGVHVGECGAYNRTPHAVVLAWLGDWLELWRQAHWGWALWMLRGSLGIFDSGRTDVAYENYQGHRLDRALLELLTA